jgi:hypothetical protein
LTTFDVTGVTLLLKVKPLLVTLVKQFGHWMPQFDRDIDQLMAILIGNGIHHVCVS